MFDPVSMVIGAGRMLAGLSSTVAPTQEGFNAANTFDASTGFRTGGVLAGMTNADGRHGSDWREAWAEFVRAQLAGCAYRNARKLARGAGVQALAGSARNSIVLETADELTDAGYMGGKRVPTDDVREVWRTTDGRTLLLVMGLFQPALTSAEVAFGADNSRNTFGVVAHRFERGWWGFTVDNGAYNRAGQTDTRIDSMPLWKGTSGDLAALIGRLHSMGGGLPRVEFGLLSLFLQGDELAARGFAAGFYNGAGRDVDPYGGWYAAGPGAVMQCDASRRWAAALQAQQPAFAKPSTPAQVAWNDELLFATARGIAPNSEKHGKLKELGQGTGTAGYVANGDGTYRAG